MYKRGNLFKLPESVTGNPPFSNFISLANFCFAFFVTMAFIKVALFLLFSMGLQVSLIEEN
jgi:hypothetical protein